MTSSIARRRYGAACAVAAVVLLATACGTDEPPTEAAPPSAPDVDVHRAPAIKGWSTVHGIAVPLGADDGPTSESGKPFTGYTRTPQGAALAVIDQSVQLATATDGQWSKTLATVTTPGPGRDAWAGNRALVSITSTDPATAPEIIGYTVENYTPDTATVVVVQRFADDSLAATTTATAWHAGDWKLVLPDATATDNPVAAIAAPPPGMVDLEGTRQ